MTPFNPNATCPKCGGGEIGARHVEASSFPDLYSERKCRLTVDEHIIRRCTTCGYSWPEAPLDREIQAIDHEKISRFLWDLLDDIDTLDDAAKGDDSAFRKRVYPIQRRRYEVSESDGFHVTFTGNPAPHD